jgi:hypothetical protein
LWLAINKVGEGVVEIKAQGIKCMTASAPLTCPRAPVSMVSADQYPRQLTCVFESDARFGWAAAGALRGWRRGCGTRSGGTRTGAVGNHATHARPCHRARAPRARAAAGAREAAAPSRSRATHTAAPLGSISPRGAAAGRCAGRGMSLVRRALVRFNEQHRRQRRGRREIWFLRALEVSRGVAYR